MTHLRRSITRNALVLLAGAAGLGAWSQGADFGLGVAATAAVMAGSVGMNWLALRRVTAAMADGRPAPGATAPFVLKVPLIAAAAVLLLDRFPPLSIAVGGCVVVGAIVLHAVSETALAPREA